MSVERAPVVDRAVRSTRRPPLRSVPMSSRSPRAPFVVLVLTILGVGMIGLLLLNTSLQQGAFVLEELQSETELLRDQKTMLADEVAARAAPDALARKARGLGMVPVDEPLFLQLPGRLGDGADAGGGAADGGAAR